MEIKMYVRKCIITRPNTDVIFRPDSPNIWSIICKYLDDGKLLYRGVDFSEDGLTRIDTYIFDFKDDCTAMMSEPAEIFVSSFINRCLRRSGAGTGIWNMAS